jgi:hypothetical protein
MAPRYSDPGKNPEISSYQLAKVGHQGQGLPPVRLNFENLRLESLRPVHVVSKKTGIDRTRRVLPKKR